MTKELVEMVPENWDGKTRKMLVWCNDTTHTKPVKRMVCGYDPIHLGWLVAETQVVWKHCAEIPEESKEEYSLNDFDENGYGCTIFSILKE